MAWQVVKAVDAIALSALNRVAEHLQRMVFGKRAPVEDLDSAAETMTEFGKSKDRWNGDCSAWGGSEQLVLPKAPVRKAMMYPLSQNGSSRVEVLGAVIPELRLYDKAYRMGANEACTEGSGLQVRGQSICYMATAGDPDAAQLSAGTMGSRRSKADLASPSASVLPSGKSYEAAGAAAAGMTPAEVARLACRGPRNPDSLMICAREAYAGPEPASACTRRENGEATTEAEKQLCLQRRATIRELDAGVLIPPAVAHLFPSLLKAADAWLAVMDTMTPIYEPLGVDWAHQSHIPISKHYKISSSFKALAETAFPNWIAGLERLDLLADFTKAADVECDPSGSPESVAECREVLAGANSTKLSEEQKVAHLMMFRVKAGTWLFKNVQQAGAKLQDVAVSRRKFLDAATQKLNKFIAAEIPEDQITRKAFDLKLSAEVTLTVEAGSAPLPNVCGDYSAIVAAGLTSATVGLRWEFHFTTYYNLEGTKIAALVKSPDNSWVPTPFVGFELVGMFNLFTVHFQ